MICPIVLFIEAKSYIEMGWAKCTIFGGLNTGEVITQSIWIRLAAIIFNLRGTGYNIESLDKEGDGCRFVEYVLHEKREDAV